MPQHTSNGTRTRGPLVPVIIVLVIVVVVLVVILATRGSSGSSDGRPTAQLSPSESTYHNGQTITISVAANKYFAPYSRIIIIQCADAGGSTSNLPVNDSTCDGNTTSGHSILVNKDGSFSEQSYTVYRDLSAWQVGLTFAQRNNQGGADEEIVYLSLTLKAFPAASLRATE